MFITNKQTNKQYSTGTVVVVVVSQKEEKKGVVSLKLVRKAWCNTSFSYSAEDIPIIQEIEKIAKDDGFSFSQLVMRQLRDLYHARKPAQVEEQIHLDSYVENSEFRPMPSLLDPFPKWKAHIDDSEAEHITESEKAASSIAHYCHEAWRRKNQEAIRERIRKAAAAKRGEGITQ